MVDEDYEIMPHREIAKLKKQIEELKAKTSEGSSSKDLMNSMDTLTKSMNSMTELFRTAAEEMKFEEGSEDVLSKGIEPLMTKLEKLEENLKNLSK